MIIGENFVFIHTPKTGGMSFTRWLINNVGGRIWVIAPADSMDHTKRSIMYDDVSERVEMVEGGRHETLPEARALLQQHNLPEPEFVFSVIRDPYDLLHSYYSYLRKPHIVARRHENDPNVNLALNSDFKTFSNSCQFFERDVNEVTEYFEHPASFKNVDVVPLENVANYLQFRFEGHDHYGRYNLEHRNASTKKAIDDKQRAAIQSNIYQRYHKLRDVYNAALLDAKTKDHWQVAPPAVRVKTAMKKSTDDALSLALKLIGQLEKEQANKDIQINKIRSDGAATIEKQLAEMMSLRKSKSDLLTKRDKTILALKADKEKLVADLKAFQAERSSTLKQRDDLILRLKSDMDVKDAHLKFLLGKKLFAQGNLTSAIDALSESISLNPNQYNANYLLGKVYAQMNDISLCTRYLTAAKAADKNKAKIIDGLIANLTE